jgi:hypothetical protein
VPTESRTAPGGPEAPTGAGPTGAGPTEAGPTGVDPATAPTDLAAGLLPGGTGPGASAPPRGTVTISVRTGPADVALGAQRDWLVTGAGTGDTAVRRSAAGALDGPWTYGTGSVEVHSSPFTVGWSGGDPVTTGSTRDWSTVVRGDGPPTGLRFRVTAPGPGSLTLYAGSEQGSGTVEVLSGGVVLARARLPLGRFEVEVGYPRLASGPPEVRVAAPTDGTVGLAAVVTR